MMRTVVVAGWIAGLILAASWSQAAAWAPLAGLSKAKNFTVGRQSSADPSGGNDDGRQDWPILPGETRTLAEIDGAGAITHIWTTIASEDRRHLRNMVLRMYWDGEPTPSVETPIGDFFGQGNGMYYPYSSLPFQIGTNNGLNCFWRMPFAKGARVTLTNEGPVACGAFYYYINYERYKRLPKDDLRFHAQYRQAHPCQAGQNYTFLEATGRGHYVGVNLSIHLRSDGWWGEGDDMIYIDGAREPQLIGTGSEDYFCGAWCYGAAFSNLYFGCPQRGEHVRSSYWNVYRYHIEDPIPFAKSIRVTIEHGHANDRADDFASVAYWYQTEPHAPFPLLPPQPDRTPKSAVLYREPNVVEGESEVELWKSSEPAQTQDLTVFGAFSGGMQLWFRPNAPETYVRELDSNLDRPAAYAMDLWYVAGPDYGLCEYWVNDVKAAAWDGYESSGVVRRSMSFPIALSPGKNRIEVRIVGKNPKSSGFLAGIDCYRLTPTE